MPVQMLDLVRRVIPERFRPIGYLTRLVRTRSGMRVRSGPFAGMRYLQYSIGSAYLPKLLGLYERELTKCIEAACALDPSLVVDVGAAEGYYAVGMACKNPRADVVAFETDLQGQAAIKEMAGLNGVANRVLVRGKCGLKDLGEVLPAAGRALVICDVEGYEEVLLQPAIVPALTRVHLLVEMHEFVHPGVTERITGRFASSHHISRIWQEPRQTGDFPFRTLGTWLLPDRYLNWAVCELRPEKMSWLWMEPRNTS